MTERRAHIDPGELPDESLEDRHFTVPDRIAHYFRDVLRLEPGDAVELFDGRGRVLEGHIQSCRNDRVQLAVFEDRKTDRNESPCRLTLCAAMPKRKRWRWILEKTTELGVARIVPLETDHGVVEIPEDRLEHKSERWRKILGEAARQSERTRTPEIAPPRSLDEALGETGHSEALDLVLHARSDSPPLGARLEPFAARPDAGPAVRLWVGPEGGFAEAEIDGLVEAGGQPCSLGPRILRAETAAVVATALVQAHLGDLSPPRDSSESGG